MVVTSPLLVLINSSYTCSKKFSVAMLISWMTFFNQEVKTSFCAIKLTSISYWGDVSYQYLIGVC